ncbi:MAG TPA: nuclear transport factor 2 family protein [Capsulimonadaceae bacterium]|jgi:ketosteroid isomerase-like protein
MEIGVSIKGLDDDERKLIDATLAILEAMYSKDAARYASLVVDDVTSIEPYIAPYRIEGLGFHLSLITDGGNAFPARLDLLTPRVQLYGTTGVVSYTLLKTFSTNDHSEFATINETRVFAKIGDSWKMVHLHKSPTSQR